MSARQRTSARVLAKRKVHHQETEHRAAHRVPAFGDRVRLPEGVCELRGWCLDTPRGYLLHLVDAPAAEPVHVSYSAWKALLYFDPNAAEWRERSA